MSLVGKPYVPDRPEKPGQPKLYYGECVSLLKYYIPELLHRGKTTGWFKGPNVIESLKKGCSIMPGTAIATFNKYRAFDGHAAFFAGTERGKNGEIFIVIVDQYKGSKPSNGIISRRLRNLGKDANGNYVEPSNNGEAFAVIL
jgi:hypothetical protein